MSYGVPLLCELYSFRKGPPNQQRNTTLLQKVVMMLEFAWGLRWGRESQHGGHQSQREEVSVSLEEMAAGGWGSPEMIKLGIQSKPA